MADIALNPTGTRHDRVVGGQASVTGIKFGFVVLKDTSATTNHAAVTTTTTACDKPVAGVVVSVMDPTNGSAVGDKMEICDLGIVEVLLAASQTIVKGDKLVTSTTAGAVKKYASETGGDIVGRSNMDAASSGTPILISMTLTPGAAV